MRRIKAKTRKATPENNNNDSPTIRGMLVAVAKSVIVDILFMLYPLQPYCV